MFLEHECHYHILNSLFNWPSVFSSDNKNNCNLEIQKSIKNSNFETKYVFPINYFFITDKPSENRKKRKAMERKLPNVTHMPEQQVGEEDWLK